MPEWLETVLTFLGAGTAGGFVPKALELIQRRREQRTEQQAAVHEADTADLGKFRQEMWDRISQQDGRIETLRGQIDEWQDKYRELATQNVILAQQNELLKEENEQLKKAIAVLEKENEALTKRLNEVDP